MSWDDYKIAALIDERNKAKRRIAELEAELQVWRDADTGLRFRIAELEDDQRSIVKVKDEEIERLLGLLRGGA